MSRRRRGRRLRRLLVVSVVSGLLTELRRRKLAENERLYFGDR